MIYTTTASRCVKKRESFLPFISELKKHNTVFKLNSEVDYREKLMLQEFNERFKTEDYLDTYFAPFGEETKHEFNMMFHKYTGNKPAVESELEVIKGRSIKVYGTSKIGRFDFKQLIDTHYGASDFIAICNKYHVIFLDNIPRIDMTNRNLARRFILFVS